MIPHNVIRRVEHGKGKFGKMSWGALKHGKAKCFKECLCDDREDRQGGLDRLRTRNPWHVDCVDLTQHPAVWVSMFMQLK